MGQEELKQPIRRAFDTLCKGYGFFSNAAAHLPTAFKLRGDERVQDVAAGTGIPAMALEDDGFDAANGSFEPLSQLFPRARR